MRRYVERWKEELESSPGLRHATIAVAGEDPGGGAEARPHQTVVNVLLPQQQHQGLLQWINCWATGHYRFDTMKNPLMITMEDRGMGERLKAMDRVKWTTGMLQVQAINPQMTADEIMDLISGKMTLRLRKEAQDHEPGGQRNWVQCDFRQMEAAIAESSTSTKQDMPKGSGGTPDVRRVKPQSPYTEVVVQAVGAILAEVYGVQSTSQKNATQKWQEPGYCRTPPLLFPEYPERHGGQDGKVDVSSATGGTVIISMIIPAVRWPRAKRQSTSSVIPKKSHSVIPANVARLTLTGTATPS